MFRMTMRDDSDEASEVNRSGFYRGPEERPPEKKIVYAGFVQGSESEQHLTSETIPLAGPDDLEKLGPDLLREDIHTCRHAHRHTIHTYIHTYLPTYVHAFIYRPPATPAPGPGNSPGCSRSRAAGPDPLHGHFCGVAGPSLIPKSYSKPYRPGP